jgi:7-cyano-7-deazaguanine synthase
VKHENGLVLLSGGIDSSTVAAVAVGECAHVAALTFRYGQRHELEIGSACRLAEGFGIREHVIIDVPAHIFSGTALTGADRLDVPKERTIDNPADIPATYVPARNILFLSYALAYAESRSIPEIYIGVNALDYSGYPDCRPEFIQKFQEMANVGTKAGVQGRPFRIHAPLISMKKSEIILLGTRLGVDYALTLSCYDPAPDGAACGSCDSCAIRRQGFVDAGVSDPTRYTKRP